MFNSGRQQRMETGIAAMWKPSPGISSERSTGGDVIRFVAAVTQGAARATGSHQFRQWWSKLAAQPGTQIRYVESLQLAPGTRNGGIAGELRDATEQAVS